MSWIRHARYRMGTVWEMAVFSTDRPQALGVLAGAFEEVARLERLMSRFLPDSQVSHLARMAGLGHAPIAQELYDVLAQAQAVSMATAGAFDVTMAPLVRLWSRAGVCDVLPTSLEIRCALALVAYQDLALTPDGPMASLRRPGMSLDLGAIGKGFAVDRTVEWLRAQGYTRGWVNAGGNVRFLGAWDRPVLVRDPDQPDRALLGLIVEREAVSTSANYERAWQIGGRRYGHLLDPRTGWPASESLSVTVLAPSAALADALSTALFVLGPQRGRPLCESLPDVHALWCVREGGNLKILMTAGLSHRCREALPAEEEATNADVAMA